MRVTLLTDFGTADGYAAAMKGVMASITPSVIIDDAAHDILPGDVRAAAWAVAAYWRRYPRGTVHVVVVDPGVGSGRRALALECDGRFLTGPDNGVFTRVLAEATAVCCVALENRAVMGDVVSSTFHGRDVFAPAAAHLARGFDFAALGPPVADPVCFTLPQPVLEEHGSARGEVVHVDRFGNLISNLPADLVAGAAVRIAGTPVPLVRTYADAAPGELLAVVGSRALLEVAVRDGSAAQRLGCGVGAAVTLRGPLA
jgi:S-adenosyl-L-methionine hydrolase (adenosine-forming)